MPSRQGYIVRGMRKQPLTQGAGVRAQASRLPQLYGQRMAKEYQEKQIGLGEQRLALGREQMSMKREQFQKGMKAQKEAADVAAGGMMLKGGLGIAKGMAAKGMFDVRLGQAKALYAGTPSDKVAPAPGQQYGRRQPSGMRSSTYGEQFAAGGWKSGAAGGISGGLFGAGAARALGARKKWQTAAAGAAGGMISSFMAGGSDPFSIALGGALGGGLGMLL